MMTIPTPDLAARLREERDRYKRLLEAALAPKRLEIRTNPDGTLDEIVGVGSIHLEQMSRTEWFLGIGTFGMFLHTKHKAVRASPRDFLTWSEASASLAPEPAAAPKPTAGRCDRCGDPSPEHPAYSADEAVWESWRHAGEHWEHRCAGVEATAGHPGRAERYAPEPAAAREEGGDMTHEERLEALKDRGRYYTEKSWPAPAPPAEEGDGEAPAEEIHRWLSTGEAPYSEAMKPVPRTALVRWRDGVRTLARERDELVEALAALSDAIEEQAERDAIQADLGVSEWAAMLTDQARVAFSSARALLARHRNASASVDRSRAVRSDELAEALASILAEYDATYDAELDGDRWACSAAVTVQPMERARALLARHRTKETL